jgi:hypothetical protein
MIAIVGAHRTGKSSLAKAFAEKNHSEYLATTATGTFNRMGYDPKLDYGIDDRIKIQFEILKDISDQYASAKNGFITDRAPVDMAAYMLADIQRESCNAQQDMLVNLYLQDCVKITNKYFNLTYCLRPGIKVVEEKGKAPGGYGYVKHIDSLIVGLLYGDYTVKTNMILAIETGVDQSLPSRLEQLCSVASMVRQEDGIAAPAVERKSLN